VVGSAHKKTECYRNHDNRLGALDTRIPSIQIVRYRIVTGPNSQEEYMNQSINQRNALSVHVIRKSKSRTSLRWCTRRLFSIDIVKTLRELAFLVLILVLIGIAGRVESEDAERVAKADLSVINMIGDQ
jgi:hypothetical protein